MTTKTKKTSNALAIEPNITHIAFAVLALAASGLAFEVALTRLFSLLFQYHYVFLVVSLSILGLGVGAALGYLAQRFGLAITERSLTISALILAFAFLLSAGLLANYHSGEMSAFVLIVAALPFLLLGWINARIYARFARWSSILYGADLVGAALGLLSAIGLIMLFGPFGMVIALGALAGAAALLLGTTATASRRRWLAIASVPLFLLVLSFANRGAAFIAYHPEDVSDAPFDKTMVHILRDPSYGASILDTEWGAFAQIDVVEINNPNERYVFTDAGAGSFMIRYDPDEANQDYLDVLKRDTAYLPFETGPVADTLIVGAGAGRDVLMAQMAGADRVTAVEINPAIVDITRKYADYNGGILDLPGVTTIITDGRNFADHSDEQFDLVYLNNVYSQAATPGVAALAESYAFTTEAIRAYWGRLNDGGRIAFVTHNGLEAVRLLMTTLEALQSEGFSLSEALSHTAMAKEINEQDPTIEVTVLLITRQAWTEEDSQAFAWMIDYRAMQPLFIPNNFEGSLSMLVDGSMTLDAYLADNTEFNITPTTDDSPFFYHSTFSLPGVLEDLLKYSALLVFGYITVVSVLQPRKPTHEWTRIDLVLYFALLGMGFMLVEVPLIQKFALLLGDPVLAMVVTVSALLLGGGMGSLFSGRYAETALPKIVTLSAVGVSIWVLVFMFVYPPLAQWVLPASLFVRAVVTALVLFPLGFLIGMPFPIGLRLAGNADANGVPLFWGVNAVASTFGAVLATTIALLAGFQAVLWLGVALYLAVAALVALTWRRVLAL